MFTNLSFRIKFEILGHSFRNIAKEEKMELKRTEREGILVDFSVIIDFY